MASHQAVCISGNAVTNYRKKNFRTQKSDETDGFGPEIAWIRHIRNSEVPIPTLRFWTAILRVLLIWQMAQGA